MVPHVPADAPAGPVDLAETAAPAAHINAGLALNPGSRPAKEVLESGGDIPGKPLPCYYAAEECHLEAVPLEPTRVAGGCPAPIAELLVSLVSLRGVSDWPPKITTPAHGAVCHSTAKTGLRCP